MEKKTVLSIIVAEKKHRPALISFFLTVLGNLRSPVCNKARKTLDLFQLF